MTDAAPSPAARPAVDSALHGVDLAALEPPVALGALDGRYRGAVAPLVNHLSEAALNRARVHVEVEWLIHLPSSSICLRRFFGEYIQSIM